MKNNNDLPRNKVGRIRAGRANFKFIFQHRIRYSQVSGSEKYTMNGFSAARIGLPALYFKWKKLTRKQVGK